MTLHPAIKVVIITEKMIVKGICDIIDQCGATGYTLMAAGGKGSHGIRSISDTASVIDDFTDMRIEVIVQERDMAEEIMNEVAKTYFDEYAGITYLDIVEVLRPKKF